MTPALLGLLSIVSGAVYATIAIWIAMLLPGHRTRTAFVVWLLSGGVFVWTCVRLSALVLR